VSVKATPVSATALAAGFVSVKLSEVVLFRPKCVASNALAVIGATTSRLVEGA
jgi:hypothetical protein